MLSRLIDSCSIRQAARHIASILARRKVENVTWFHPKGQRKHFGPELLRFDQLELVLSIANEKEKVSVNQTHSLLKRTACARAAPAGTGAALTGFGREGVLV